LHEKLGKQEALSLPTMFDVQKKLQSKTQTHHLNSQEHLKFTELQHKNIKVQVTLVSIAGEWISRSWQIELLERSRQHASHKTLYLNRVLRFVLRPEHRKADCKEHARHFQLGRNIQSPSTSRYLIPYEDDRINCLPDRILKDRTWSQPTHPSLTSKRPPKEEHSYGDLSRDQ